MNGFSEREVIPRTRDFLIHTARHDIGPRLRAVYEEGMEAQEKRREGSLIVAPKNASTIELTTSADRRIDDQIRNAWQRKFPNIPWYSEDSKDRRVKGLRVEQLKQLPTVLVVDMIDGSGRLARNSDRFSSSFALVSKGKVVLALIYQPVTDTLWSAEEDEDGAYKNGKRIYVSTTNDLDKAMVSTAFPWDLKKRSSNQRKLDRLSVFVNQVVGTASSVLDGVDVAQGLTDAHVSEGLKPWDHAGFSFLTQKTGGESTSYQGEYSPFEDKIVVSNGVVHEDLLRIINRNAVLSAFMTMYRIRTRGDISKERGLMYKTLNQARKGIIFLSKKGSSKK